jgi:hypothetical protein
MNEHEMDLIRQGLTMLLHRNLDTRDFIKKSDANFRRHEHALPIIEEEIGAIEALLAKLPQALDSAPAEEAPPKKLAPSEKEKTARARKKKTS